MCLADSQCDERPLEALRRRPALSPSGSAWETSFLLKSPHQDAPNSGASSNLCQRAVSTPPSPPRSWRPPGQRSVWETPSSNFLGVFAFMMTYVIHPGVHVCLVYRIIKRNTRYTPSKLRIDPLPTLSNCPPPFPVITTPAEHAHQRQACLDLGLASPYF